MLCDWYLCITHNALCGCSTFYSMVLYSASLSGQILSIEDLPELPLDRLSAIEQIVGPTGDNYKLSTTAVSQLRRFKMAMNIVLDKWVARLDRQVLLNTIRNKLVERTAGRIPGPHASN